MYVVQVTLEIHEALLEEFLDGIHRNALASLRDEPGCLRFDVLRSTDTRARFYFYEIYRDRRAFEFEHRSAPHYASWQEVVAQCVIPGTQVNTYSAPVFPEDVPERPVQP